MQNLQTHERTVFAAHKQKITLSSYLLSDKGDYLFATDKGINYTISFTEEFPLGGCMSYQFCIHNDNHIHGSYDDKDSQTISFYQNEPVSEKVKEVTMRFGFYDQAGHLLSDSTTLTFSSTSEDSAQREQKHRFMFKRQLSELNGQEIYLRKEQQVAGSTQFKKLEDIAYKVSVLFMAEF